MANQHCLGYLVPGNNHMNKFEFGSATSSRNKVTGTKLHKLTLLEWYCSKTVLLWKFSDTNNIDLNILRPEHFESVYR